MPFQKECYKFNVVKMAPGLKVVKGKEFAGSHPTTIQVIPLSIS
jgi:hypothetical protein